MALPVFDYSFLVPILRLFFSGVNIELDNIWTYIFKNILYYYCFRNEYKYKINKKV